MRSKCMLMMPFTLLHFVSVVVFVLGERMITKGENTQKYGGSFLSKAINFLWQSGESGYQHVWPEIEFGWRIILGTIIGFFGAAFGSVGGVGGGGIFVPMLSLVIGFDAKSSTALSKCMIMGAALSTVYYNLNLRHPTLDLPIIDYDLALLIQPMLMLGISIGVVFNVVVADWMVTMLLIILFLGTSAKAFSKGVETWKKETIVKEENARKEDSNGFGTEVEYRPIPNEPDNDIAKETKREEVNIIENVYWKEFGLLVLVWVAFLAIQIAMSQTTKCSTIYWVFNILQIPVSVGVAGYEAVSLYKGRRAISSVGDQGKSFTIPQLALYSFFGISAGIVGGLLGIGGGFVMGPLFLELGVPPQVASATATFAMVFSSSMSVVEYYLLKRFPVPYALYFIVVAAVSAIVGQHIVRKLIDLLGRASLIIFVLAFTIFVSAVSLGGVGIAAMVKKIENHEYMGFDDLCKYNS
ncbi:sulfite exporter TauE/SafE family protein 3 [Vigna radiata var. radiata]|uniref:Sulfite exporter TauE/SafE family protein 3 n=1 Tax=Vigna radiata var. radiata TaxID=3916 RepID=A0A1S3UHB0_VIGRR|nr:sulfite exporter TauE/SafE family protein 3 [Vigna radiata var. radiata]